MSYALRSAAVVPDHGSLHVGDRLVLGALPKHERRGYATEAAAAMVSYAFEVLRLRRIVATTEHGNKRSLDVMRRLGMRIERNPDTEPVWLQSVGILDSPS